ncbi:dixin-like isoform X2 [Ptychodera flava]|uniref:dixin-like isoform X2 n=1 Tax=Ptychodera flava TaxID=63121 RepID=UPI00396A81CB
MIKHTPWFHSYSHSLCDELHLLYLSYRFYKLLQHAKILLCHLPIGFRHYAGQQQLQAYVAWVNSQLKKRPGCQLVEDLRRDMQDGVALVHLVEIVSGETLQRVDFNPQTTAAMRENIDRVLQFMAAKRIRMHHTSAKDIVDGNLKAVMRLILALAAHYKPSSVKQSGYQSSGKAVQRTPSAAAMAANVAAGLRDIRNEIANAGQTPRRFREHHHHRSSEHRYSNHSPHGSPQPGTPVISTPVRPPRAKDRFAVTDVDSPSPGSSPSISAHHSPSSSFKGTPPSSGRPLDRRRVPQSLPFQSSQTGSVSGKASDSDQGSVCDDKSSQCSSSSFWNDLQEEQSDLAKELEETKKMVITLQDLLLNGQIPDGGASDAEEDQLLFEGANPKEQVVVLQSRLDQCQAECNDVKTELSKHKQESRNLQGVKQGLQSRLTEQDNSLLQLKAELLRIGFTQQNLEAENAELKRKLEEKSRSISDMTRQIQQKDKLLTQQQLQIEEVTRQLQDLNLLKIELQNEVQLRDDTTSNLESQVKDLSNRLGNVGLSESNLAGRVAMQDRMMAKLEGKILQSNEITTNHYHHPIEMNEELQVMRDSLRNLRASFSGHDPQHHTLDTLEQSIAAMVDRVRSTQSRRNSDSSSTESVSRHGYLQDRDPRRSPITSFSMSGGVSPYTNGPSSTPCTKVLYFTERTVTPFMSSIPKRLGEITLRDFKEIFDRLGNYRFHFKALDPEFGTVKEEVSSDDDIVPGWEGKIVAWIEEDNG